MSILDRANHPFPERKWLGVRIINAKNPHPLSDPKFKNALQYLPHRPRIRTLKIERIYILVFLWRILGVLNRPVRTLPEPIRLLPHPRMIRRTLKRDI